MLASAGKQSADWSVSRARMAGRFGLTVVGHHRVAPFVLLRRPQVVLDGFELSG